MPIKNVEINIGKVCNNNCRFCMSGQDEAKKFGFIAKETILKELKEKARQGFNSVGFLGGEFTLHPDILEILAAAKKNNFEIIHIISNGRKYQDTKFLKELIDLGVNRFSVSIHSNRADVEDYLTQRQGGFKEKLKGIRNLLDYYKQGLISRRICLNLVVNKLNYQELDKFLLFFSRLGIKDFRFNYMWPEGNVLANKKLIVKYGELADSLKKINKLADKLKIDLVWEGIPPCTFPDFADNVKFSGELRDYPTTVLSLTDYDGSDNSDAQILRREFDWQQRKENYLKIKNKFCSECKFTKLCEGVWRTYIDLFGWSEFKPVKK